MSTPPAQLEAVATSRELAILGSTGSIGCSTLEVVAANPDRLQVVGLTAHGNLSKLVEQAKKFEPRFVVATDEQAGRQFDWSQLPPHTKVLYGPDGVNQLVSQPEVDTVVSAIVGAAGLRGTWTAIEQGKTIALANKETMVIAGGLVRALASDRGATILPVDSEHNAIFQALQAGRDEDVRRLILTASGGPFRQHSLEQLGQVSVADALNHPTWNMGTKITIDSATMMNKALEVIEARWLFDLPAEKLDVVVHPQSIVHSMVEFCDGSVIAQLSPPDMKLPIQYALSYPQRWEGSSARLDLTTAFSLDFQPPDRERFPALDLGFEVANRGGTCGAVLNAANEAAVSRFVDGELNFRQITKSCQDILQNHHYDPCPTLEQLEKIDHWAREEVLRWKPC